MKIPTVSEIRDLTNDGPRDYAPLAGNNRAINELLNEAEANAWHDEVREKTIAKMEQDYGDADIPF